MEGWFVGVNVDPKKSGISYVVNVGCVSSERWNELLDTNDDRRNNSVLRNFIANDLPRSKMLQKVVAFGLLQ